MPDRPDCTKKLFLVLFLFLAAGMSSGCSTGSDLPVTSLVSSERAFAALSLARGTRAAFLEFLDDSSVLFRPHPVNGKEWFRSQEPRTTILDWGPSFADCSVGGELGYTTGPWRFYRKSRLDEPAGYGYFITVWGRKPGAPWRVLVDVGTSNPRPPSDSVSLTLGPLSQAELVAAGRGREFYERAESLFIRAVTEGSLMSAYRTVASPGCRFYRDDHFPARGLSEAAPMLGDPGAVVRFEPIALRASREGDLAYVYGNYETGPGAAPVEKGYYLRIWQISPGPSATLVLDFLTPLPPLK